MVVSNLHPSIDGRGHRAGRVLDIRKLTVESSDAGARRTLVDEVDLHVDSGEMLGIVGESGSGKTMTALSVLRLLPAGIRVTHGEITIGSQKVLSIPPRELYRLRGNDAAMVFQDPMSALNPTRTIGWQIAESVALHRGWDRTSSYARALEVLSLVGMPEPERHLGSYAHELSGGMRQRALIAIALSCEPSVLIADEPTTALDVTIQAQILSNLRELRRTLGMGVVLITHDLSVVVQYCDRVAVMYGGRVVETAPAARFLLEMKHRYTEALVAASPQGAARRDGQLYSIPGAPPELPDWRERCNFADRCSFSVQDCVQARPELTGGNQPDHLFACFNPRRERAAVSRPRAIQDTDADSRASQRRGLISIEGVSKNYRLASFVGGRAMTLSAVADVSAEVAAGKTLGVVGESGCGKSTLGRLIVALERPSSGRILLDGLDLNSLRGRRLRAARRDLQLAFQNANSALDPRMRGDEILREPLAIQGISSFAEHSRRIRRVLGDVGLPSRTLDKFPYELSGGQQQRLGLARALVLEPKVIVADEPVSSLDVSVQAQVLNLMVQIQASRGLTYVFISHDLGVVRYMSDTIAVMYLGRLVEIGPSEQIYSAPEHPYTRALLDSIPTLVRAPGRTAPLGGELPSAVRPPSGCRFRTRCPRAQDVCAEVTPSLKAPSSEFHPVACHFPLVGAQSPSMSF
jgi:peptide/nickel transport system ATP-binding protein